MSDFENATVTLLTEIRDHLAAIRQTIEETVASSSQTSSELISSVFGFLQNHEEK